MSAATLSRQAVRLVSFLALPALTAAFLFKGASPLEAKTSSKDLNMAELESRLANPDSGLTAFTGELRSAMLAGDVEAAESHVDRVEVLTRATSNVKYSNASGLREMFADSTLKTWDRKGPLAEFNGTNFRFIRPLTLKGRAGLLFRSCNDAGLLNYSMFTIRTEGASDYRITDVLSIGLNEFLSETLNRTYRHIVASFSEGEGVTIPGVNQAYVDGIQEVARLAQALSAGKYEEVLVSSAALPAALRHERTVMLLRMDAADKFSSEARNALYEQWLTLFPDEQELPLKLANYYITNQRWDDAQRVLKNLETRIGSDMRLSLHQGEISFGRRAEKRRLVAEADLSSSAR